MPDNEFVTFPIFTDRDSDPDDDKGDNRSMIGIKSRQRTTTVKVISVKMSMDQYAEMVWQSNKKAYQLKNAARKAYVDVIEQLLITAACFPINSIAEYRAGHLKSRVLGKTF